MTPEDIKLETQINSALVALVEARTEESRRKAWNRMRELLAMRSAGRIDEMHQHVLYEANREAQS